MTSASTDNSFCFGQSFLFGAPFSSSRAPKEKDSESLFDRDQILPANSVILFSVLYFLAKFEGERKVEPRTHKRMTTDDSANPYVSINLASSLLALNLFCSLWIPFSLRRQEDQELASLVSFGWISRIWASHRLFARNLYAHILPIQADQQDRS